MFGVDDLINAGASAFSASEMAAATEEAARIQAAQAQKALDLQEKMFNKGIELQEPWRTAGVEALNKLKPLLDYQTFGTKQFQADPGYAFRLAEGQKALERSAAARGGLLSGATLKGTQRFGQDLASQEYSNAFNRYQIERAARLNPYQAMAGVGQTAAGQIAQSGQTYAGAAGQALQDIGTARASGYVGGANALNQALGGFLNYYQNKKLVNALTGGPSMRYSGGSSSNDGLMGQLSDLGVF